MTIFDAPTRESCIARRERTNTPLQALVTLNDVQFVEAGRNFAQRIILGSQDETTRIQNAFRLVTARTPSPQETDTLREMLTDVKTKYAGDTDAAKQLVTAGESRRDESIDVVQHAAWTIVASALLNLDETLTRE